MNLTKTADFLVVGGGVVGLTIARALTQRHPNSKITLLEKEPEVSLHTTGRNSGVLHAGFYYSTESMKAAFCRKGNVAWHQYCEEENLPVKKCGKLVVPKNALEVERMKKLYEQGMINQVPLEMISLEDARKMDKNVTGYGSECIYSPTTSVVDTKLIMNHMKNQLLAKNPNFSIEMETEYVARNVDVKEGVSVKTNKGDFSCGRMINAAGQQSLYIAHDFPLTGTHHFDIFPLKGLYAISEKPLDDEYKMLVYPIPMEGSYILGVHTTITPGGFLKIGPTLTPAFAMENYKGLEKVSLNDLLRTVKLYMWLLASNERGLIWQFITQEMKKLSIGQLVSDVSQIHKVDKAYFKSFYRPGIRAQLVDTRDMKIQNDFMIRRDDFSVHVLNLVSPGWTSAIPMAEHIVDEVEKTL